MRIFVVIFVPILASLVKAEHMDIDETEDERIEGMKSEFQLTMYDIMDLYDEVSKQYNDVLINDASYEQKIEAEIKYSNYLRNQSVTIGNIIDDLPYDLSRFATILKKTNNEALDTKDFEELVRFANNMEEISKNTIIEDSESNIFDKHQFLHLLATSRNDRYLVDIYDSLRKSSDYTDVNYTHILSLVQKAASKNGDYDSKTFWEDMSQYENGYEIAQNIWNEIEPFYKQFHKFVLDRINKFYNTNYANLPVYLTGSFFGDEYSNIADIVLPHQQIYHDAKMAINEKSKTEIYKHCNKISQDLTLKEHPKQFWKNSHFDLGICSPKVLSFCSQEYSAVLTCSNTTWLDYIQAQETSFKIGLNNLDYSSLPVRELRSSFIEEAVEGLGSIIAIHDLPIHEFIEKDSFIDNIDNQNAARLLLALHVLPKLAYYISVDTWRLNELEFPSGNIRKAWWETRLKYQGIEGITYETSDFLHDEYVIYNKPYLSKFFGLLAPFDFIQQLDVFSADQSMPEKLKAQSFQSLINDITSKDPKEILSYHYSLEDVTSVALLQYFGPLEEYFKSAPLEPVPLDKRNLRKLKTTTSTVETTVATVAQETPKQIFKLSTERMLIEESTSEKPKKEEKSAGFSVGIYVLITIGACGVIIIGLLVFKRLVKIKRPRPVNRRFEA